MTLVSVVVPCYNTERYLDVCLESLVAQGHTEWEAIAVDDGSTDRTAAMLDQWARSDPRIHVIHRPNGGLGAARNTGLDAAQGEYVTFLDSDDLLTPDALARMVETIERTGSDFVSGVANRFDGERQWRASLYRRGFREDLDGTHVYERPSLLNDHIVCAKLFRRSFWDHHELRFPEGTLFEDIEIATRAHCWATSVDLLAEPTYLWRSRPADDASITQDRRRPGAAAARFAALGSVDRFLRDEAPSNVWRRHGMKVMTIDIPLYGRELEVGDARFADEFFASARPVVASLSPDAVASLSPMHGLLRDAVLDGDTSRTSALVTLLKSSSLPRRIESFRTLSRSAKRMIVIGATRARLRAARRALGGRSARNGN